MQGGDRGAAVAAGDRQQQLPLPLLHHHRSRSDVSRWLLQPLLQRRIHRSMAAEHQQDGTQQVATPGQSCER
jgi:hypothetical protein